MEHPANTRISEGFACLENVRLLNIIAKILLVAFRESPWVRRLPDPQCSVCAFFSPSAAMAFSFPPTPWINVEFAKEMGAAAPT